MRILIDATTAREGGGVTYIRNIISALLQLNSSHIFSILLSCQYQKKLANMIPDRIEIEFANIPLNTTLRAVYLQIIVPKIIRKKKFDLLFTVAELGVIWPPCPHIVMVQNPKFFAYAKCIADRKLRWELFIRRASRWSLILLMLRNANFVLFVSETLRNDAISRIPELMHNSQAILHGLNPIFQIRDGNKEPAYLLSGVQYLLFVSSINRHKNHKNLIKAFAKIVNTKSYPGLYLMLVGSLSETKLYNELLFLAAKLGISKLIKFTDCVKHEELPDIYRNARIFIFPSYFESFGMPLVEAMACGVPVIASDIPTHREICQECALFFAPHDSESLANQIKELMNNGNLAAEMVKKGIQRAKAFSWDHAAKQHLNAFQLINDTPKPPIEEANQ